MTMSVDLERLKLHNDAEGYFDTSSLVVEATQPRQGRKPTRRDLDTQSEPVSANSSPTEADRPTSWLLGLGTDEGKGSLKFFHERRSSDEVAPTPRSESAERPALIRKKSGELVKSSLKLPALARTRSMPNTKTVHFDTNLEHVRRFNYREKPAKVSFEWGGEDANGASDDDELSDDDFSEGWTISTPNFKATNYDRTEGKDRPIVYLDSLFLSPDQQYLRGNVCVRNISFAKQVTIRYTIDYWQTLSEVEAYYNSDVRRLDRAAGYDRFSFQIPLATLPSRVLRRASMFLCAKYSIENEVYWDNNNKLNYEVVFRHESHHHDRYMEKRMSAPPRFVSRRLSADDTLPYVQDDAGLDINASEIFASVALETRVNSISRPAAKEPSELKSRYSFGSAFNQPLRSPVTANQTQSTAKVKSSEATSTQPTPTNVKTNGSPTQKAPAKRVFPAAAPSQFSWDSTGYQDILSKFCFAGSDNSSPPDAPIQTVKKSAVVPSSVGKPVSPALSPSESPPPETSTTAPLQRTTSYSSFRLVQS